MIRTSKIVTALLLISTSSLCTTVAEGWSFQKNKSTNSNKSSSSSPLPPSPFSSRKDFLQKAGVVGAVAVTAGVFGLPWSAKAAVNVGGKIQYGDESIMSPKEHGTSSKPVQDDLLYGVSNKLADKICNFNRHFAEMGGYFQSTTFEKEVLEAKGRPITFYDSVTGKPLFVAPINRSPEQFIQESKIHGTSLKSQGFFLEWNDDRNTGEWGFVFDRFFFVLSRSFLSLCLYFHPHLSIGWPSFRDDEVVWENVRVLKSSGETVSVDGTHLGHNLPDRNGNRYCINLVSVAGKPV